MYQRHLMKRVYNVWENQYLEGKKESEKQESEAKQMEEINEITAKYNMELA